MYIVELMLLLSGEVCGISFLKLRNLEETKGNKYED